MPKDFSKNLVKSFNFWDVLVHENQGFLGRCVVWCKREDALDLADATTEEREELFAILHDLREATKQIFQPDWFNYAFLGNEMRHLHGHFIPRYAKPRTFMGVTFEDVDYGYNWKTDPNFVTSEAVLNAVRDRLGKSLG